ncbi:DUF4274 domain-containing protein [Cytobacillus sp. Sa5YUA1]|uniref:DUF4274 domain-containing protein n=1 Tax=Cytobacillus stercorigallinarum TaxID=2762240 RepID=A0ABR8QVZ5_9BACI|nr:DUF4274 domain-containing protein [Cytobacillus stercorigallinarum]MBD7939715.1 DUF4274 domain-containing protein [Cytobacillus stercorigallinarum]
MDEKDIIFLEQLLYNTDKDYVVNQLKNIDNPLLLHYFAENYNWNSGFDVPTGILDNKACDLGTGLLMFHYADGYRLLESSDKISSSSLEEWKVFLRKIYNKLLNLDFKLEDISFDPELTKIQKYKLKKNNPDLPNVLISKSQGKEIDISKI